MELTKSELEIMDVFWEAECPMSRSDLLERSAERTWKDSSVHILLNGLLQKGAIWEAGFVKRFKTYGRTFLPTLTREQYIVANIYTRRYQPRIVELVRALLAREEITPAQLDEIAALVEARKTQE